MANFGQSKPSEACAPVTEILPDSRRRITRFYRIAHKDKIPAELAALPWGTPDIGETPVAGWDGVCRLINRKVTDQPGAKGKDTDPLLELVFEEIHATAETIVGGPAPDDSKTEDGRTVNEVESLQFSGNTFVPGTVGTFAAGLGYLQKVEHGDDGTLHRIKRTYVSAGILATDEQTRNGGKLSLKTITSAVTVPSTPGGYTLIGAPVQNPNGLPVYSYTYAKGTGEVERRIQPELEGRITYTTVRAFGAAVAAPGEFETTVEEGDGYKIYVSRGITINAADYPDEVLVRAKGKLTITRKRKINAAPTGTGEVILDTADKLDGYTLYTRAYAVGSGLVSTENRSALNGAITYTTKRAYGTAAAATGEFETSTEDDDGYTVYISRGIVVNTADLPDEVTTRAKGKLTITRKRKINAAPTGTGEVILDTADKLDGYTLYTKAWAVGSGLVTTDNRQELAGAITYQTKRAYGTASPATGEFATTVEDDDGYTVYVSRGIVINTADLPDETETSVGGALTLTTKRKINTVPTGGTGSLIRVRAEPREGYTLYSRTWASGSGAGETRTIGEPDGAITQIVTQLATGAATPTSPGGTYYLVDLTSTPLDGYTLNVARYKQPPSTVVFRKRVQVPIPGLASFSGTTLVLNPPVTRTVLASVDVSYSTTQDTTAPFGVTTFAAFWEYYQPTDSGITRTNSDGLGGYLSAGATLSSLSPGAYRGIACNFFAAEIVASNPTARPTGATVVDVENEIYLTSTTGTIVYRRTVVTATL